MQILWMAHCSLSAKHFQGFAGVAQQVIKNSLMLSLVLQIIIVPAKQLIEVNLPDSR